MVDFPQPACPLAQTDVGRIASGARLHVPIAGYTNPATDYFRVHGDVCGELEIGFLNSAFLIEGAVCGDGVYLETCYLPAGREARIDGSIVALLEIRSLLGDVCVGDVPESGAISIAEFSGASLWHQTSLRIENGLAGSLKCGGEVQFATVEIRKPNDPLQCVTGDIIFTDTLVTGVTLAIYGDLHDPQDPQNPDPQMLGGHIILFGGLYLPGIFDFPCTIGISGTLTGPRPFIAVDYDGWDQDDIWGPLGLVQMRDPNDPNEVLMLHGNTPELHVWEITRCRGDMNNDEAVDYNDINPFVQALSDVRGYSLAYPGLGALTDPWEPEVGSRAWHGDCNCDEKFDYADINLFVTRVAEECCSDECPCPGGEGLNMSPGELAAKLAANVKPELYGDLVDIAAAAAQVQTDPKLKAYWEAVHKALAP